MRILLGGNGFIGSPLRRELRAHGHAVGVLHRTADVNLDEDVGGIKADRNRPLDSIGQIERFSPEVIVDLTPTSGEQAAQLMSIA